MSKAVDKVSDFVSSVNPFASASAAQEFERAASYNYGPVSILAAFAGSHLILQHRIPKLFLGVDNNVYPREDLRGENGEALVASGKISRRTLARLRRWEAAHYNAVENLPVFIGAIVSLQLAGAANKTINRVAAVWLSSRLAFSVLYIAVEDKALSNLRTLAWWTSNVTSIWAFVHAAKRLNHNVGTGTVAL